MTSVSASTPSTPKSTAKRLTLENLPQVLGRSIGDDGKPSWDHIYDYYAPNMRFQDSIQTIHGREPFIEILDRTGEQEIGIALPQGALQSTTDEGAIENEGRGHDGR